MAYLNYSKPSVSRQRGVESGFEVELVGTSHRVLARCGTRSAHPEPGPREQLLLWTAWPSSVPRPGPWKNSGSSPFALSGYFLESLS